MNSTTFRESALKALAVTCVVAFPLTAASCADDKELPAAGTADSADVGDVTDDDYFDNDEHMGETVTINATVGEVLSTRALVLSGADYGDESLLVLLPQPQVVEEGNPVEVTGTVRQFSYQSYHDAYDLEGPEPYDDFNGEQFLVADSFTATAQPSATATSSP